MNSKPIPIPGAEGKGMQVRRQAAALRSRLEMRAMTGAVPVDPVCQVNGGSIPEPKDGPPCAKMHGNIAATVRSEGGHARMD